MKQVEFWYVYKVVANRPINQGDQKHMKKITLAVLAASLVSPIWAEEPAAPTPAAPAQAAVEKASHKATEGMAAAQAQAAKPAEGMKKGIEKGKGHMNKAKGYGLEKAKAGKEKAKGTAKKVDETLGAASQAATGVVNTAVETATGTVIPK
jgi:hypothetical protein